MGVISDYYDGYIKKLSRDYLLGNERMVGAIRSVLSKIDFRNKKVLDIGCGIGWSSYEMSKEANEVIGIDISGKLINVAGDLFVEPNLKFKQMDVTKERLEIGSGKIDIITLIDVFEHIPSSERHYFSDALNALLKPSGLIFMSCPSIHHQNWLRKNQPEGLQPVDEDIDISVLDDFANQIDGEIVYYNYSRVWKNNDYFHVILQKKPINFHEQKHKVELETNKSKLRRFKKATKLEVIFNNQELIDLRKRQKSKWFSNLKGNLKNVLGK